MRLVDADALIEAHYDYCCKHHGEADNFYVWSLELMRNAPTIDAVPVVRCKDCKYLSFDDPNDLTWGYCDYWFDYHYENDFCNYGKAKI